MSQVLSNGLKSRFLEASIVREDIAYVVSHRLLSKTQEQKKIIRKHLEKFTPLYGEMAERMDDYEELFPVHPSYLDEFEKVTVGERRELLKAISQEMGNLLDKDVPSDEPGLITFDSYWKMIKEDNVFRAIPDVRNVLDKSNVLSDKVKRAPETKDYQAAALRIIDGLSLHRLAITDIYAPIGLTPTEIRDQLCIQLPLPEQNADFLLATIETILKSILKAVNGQFISHNKENDQYYLDLKKDIDYEALIQAKAETLDNSAIDRYYFDILSHALEFNQTASYVPGFRIWECEIPWSGHGVTRQGYIFLGAANERSTAHPERDFYIHFLGIYGNGYKDLQRKNDELYYKFSNSEKEFIEQLRLYAGAKEMSDISSGSNKDQYENKLLQSRKILVQWLRDNFLRYFKVSQLDQERTTAEAVAQHHLAMRDQTFRDQVNRLSSAMLDQTFTTKFPKYPTFTGVEMNSLTLLSAADTAFRAISGGQNTRLSQTILEGLQLGQMENGRMVWTTEKGLYSSYYMDLINHLEPGVVINHKNLVAGEPGAERDIAFQLEPELLVIVLAALLRQGSLVITCQGMKISETDLSGSSHLGLTDLLKFTSISKPKPLPEQAVKELFSQFEIPPEIINDPNALPMGVNQLQQKVQGELNHVVRIVESLRDGPKFWQQMVLPAPDHQKARKELEDFREFLNVLLPFMVPARLANLSVGVGEIRAAVKARTTLQDIEQIYDALNDLRPAWDYLTLAQIRLSANDPWQTELKEAIQFVINTLADPQKRKSQNLSPILRGRLGNLQNSYAKRYLDLHNQYRLDRGQDAIKQQLTTDPRWARMRALSKISLLSGQKLQKLKDELSGVVTCYQLQLTELQSNPSCSHCGFDPASMMHNADKASVTLDRVKQEFDLLCKTWVETLLSNLDTDDARHHLALISVEERNEIKEFLRTRSLPEPMTAKFIDAVENTLQGLEVLNVDGGDYLLALTQPGMPCTADELERRIREFLQQQLEGKDRNKIRIQINW